MLFSCCSMLIARFVAVYGDGAVAAQKVGTQVESLSGWLPTVLWPLSNAFYLTELWCRTAGSCQSRLSFHHENCSCLGKSLHITACFSSRDRFSEFFLNDDAVFADRYRLSAHHGFFTAFYVCRNYNSRCLRRSGQHLAAFQRKHPADMYAYSFTSYSDKNTPWPFRHLVEHQYLQHTERNRSCLMVSYLSAAPFVRIRFIC